MSASEQTGGNGVLETTPDMSGLHCFVLLARLLNRVINPDNLCHMMGIPDGRFAANDMVRAGQKYGFRSRVGKVLGEDYRSTIKVEAPEFSIESQSITKTDGTLDGEPVVTASLTYDHLVAAGYTDTEIKALTTEIAGDVTRYQLSTNLGKGLGSSIGRMLAGNNQFEQLATDTIIGTIGENLGRSLGQNLSSDGAYAITDDGIYDGLSDNLTTNLKAATGSLAVSFLSAELGKKLGLSGFGAGLFNASLSPVINNFLGKVTGWTTDVFKVASTGVGNAIKAGISGFIGSYVGTQDTSQIITIYTPPIMGTGSSSMSVPITSISNLRQTIEVVYGNGVYRQAEEITIFNPQPENAN